MIPLLLATLATATPASPGATLTDALATAMIQSRRMNWGPQVRYHDYARLFVDNRNGMSKIWLERTVDVSPNLAYDVDISFDFGTADFGQANLWRILSGAHTHSPATGAELTVQDATGNGSGSGVGVQWLPKSYRVRALSDAGGHMRIVIGVWGMWETPRTYYVDNVRLRFTRAG